MTMAKTANGKDEVAIMGGGPNRLEDKDEDAIDVELKRRYYSYCHL